MEANLRGIEVRGFKPQEKDLKELEARRDLRSKNVVEHEATQTRQDAQKGRQGAQQDAGKAQAAPQPEMRIPAAMLYAQDLSRIKKKPASAECARNSLKFII